MRREAKQSERSNVRNEHVSRRALSVTRITRFIRWRASTPSWARTTRPLHGWIERWAQGFAAGRSFEWTPLSVICVDYPRFRTILPRSKRTAARFVLPRFEKQVKTGDRQDDYLHISWFDGDRPVCRRYFNASSDQRNARRAIEVGKKREMQLVQPACTHIKYSLTQNA